jgi:hypothetical protein
LTQALDVTVFGTSEDVAQTRGEHLIIQVDMENYAAASGTYTVPVQIHENAPGDIGVTGTYQVQVTIREAGESHPDTNPETADPAE